MAPNNVVVLDGNPDPAERTFDRAMSELEQNLRDHGHAVTRFILRDLNIKQCVGCWSCWVRTPGRCAVDDDGDRIRRAWRHADIVVMASPLIAGFISADLKTITDKFIPLAHPYITLVDGECMHEHRYDRLPSLAALLEPTADDTEEDLRVNVEWIRRTAEHIREPLVAAVTAEEVARLVEAIDEFERPSPGDHARERPRRPAPAPLPEIADLTGPKRLVVINGSPRAPSSNTRLLMECFQTGFEEAAGNTVQSHTLHNRTARTAARDAYADSDLVIFAFPLYVHAMPGHLKRFWESIAQLPPRPGRRVGFVVQSGFPEAHQSRWLERYLVRLPARLGAESAGVVIRGGCEGIQIMPERMTRKLFASFEELGRGFGRTARFDPRVVGQLAEPESLSRRGRLFHRIMKVAGIGDWYWNHQLKNNDAYDERFARPYDEPATER